MTPKEKAIELISLFDTKQYFDENKNVLYTFEHFTIDDKKRTVKMFIEQIINAVGKLDVEVLHTQYGDKLTEINGQIRTNYNLNVLYWQQVKEEIVNL